MVQSSHDHSLDPLSQLIGAQTAQIAGVSAAVTDLRSEVIQNRLESQRRHEENAKSLEDVRIEYRSVKHDARSLEQKHESANILFSTLERRMDTRFQQIQDRFDKVDNRIDRSDERMQARLDGTDTRITAVEHVLENWKGRLVALIAIVMLVGGVVSTILQPLLTLLWKQFIGGS